MLLLTELKGKKIVYTPFSGKNTLLNFNRFIFYSYKKFLPHHYMFFSNFQGMLVFKAYKRKLFKTGFSKSVENMYSYHKSGLRLKGYFIKNVNKGYTFGIAHFLSFIPGSLIGNKKNSYYKIIRVQLQLRRKRFRMRRRKRYSINLVTSGKENG